MFTYSRALAGIWGALCLWLIRERFSESGERTMSAFFDAVFPTATDTGGWLMFLYGIGLGLFVIPLFLRWLEQEKEFERFFDELGSEKLGRARIRFFKNFSRAYHTWKSIGNNRPESIDKLISDSDFPDWIPVVEGELRLIAKEKYKDKPSELWQFIHYLSEVVDNYMRTRNIPDQSPLNKEEIEEFHEARQTLSYFWNNVGIKLLRWRKLRYRNVKHYAEAEKDLIKCLSYISIEAHISINREGRGQEITYFGAIVFEKTKWGFCQWAWNPLLTHSENLRQ